MIITNTYTPKVPDNPPPPPPPSVYYGTYKYVHEYYYRDADGKLTLEGTSPIAPSGRVVLPDSTQYTEADVGREYEYQNNTYEYDSDAYGIVSGGRYSETAGKTYVNATTAGNQIIILKYVRTATGGYRVVHEYYYRDADGAETPEGRSDIRAVEELPLDDTRYTEAGVEHEPVFGEHTYTYESAAYGGMTGETEYAADGGMEYVVATGDGAQIIILKYVRTDEPATGGYRVVHEYYYRDADGAETPEGRSGIRAVEELPLDDTRYTEAGVEREPVFGEHTYTYESAAYGGMTGETEYVADGGMEYVVATEDGAQIIILKYVRTEKPENSEDPGDPGVGAYQIVHEYYLRTDAGDRLEGRSELSQVGGLPLDGTRYTESGVERVYVYRRHNYTYDSAAYGIVSGDGYDADGDMTCVVATVDGEQVIILRYIRTLPPELPDPNDPDSPDEVIIEDGDVPKTYIKVWDPEEEEWEYIPDEDVPLWGFEVPETGDSMGLWALLAAGSLGGLCVLCAVRPKRREDDA